MEVDLHLHVSMHSSPHKFVLLIPAVQEMHPWCNGQHADLGQVKSRDYIIGICCISAQHAA